MRSVGPAGGPIEKIAWDGKTVAHQRPLDLERRASARRRQRGPRGRSRLEVRSLVRSASGAARTAGASPGIELAAEPAVRLTLRDSAPAQPNPLVYSAVRSTLELDLPDRRFVDCLNAQVAHLMMGLLDRRTPPGDPTNYPLAWQRDGVAVVAGLVRAGQLEVAKELARYLRRKRFLRRLRRRGRRSGPGPAGVGRRGRPRARSGVRPMAVAARPAQSGAHFENGLDRRSLCARLTWVRSFRPIATATIWIWSASRPAAA